MIDINLIRDNPERVKDSLRKKGHDPSVVDRVFELDKEFREALQLAQKLNEARNKLDPEEIKRALESSKKQGATPEVIKRALEIKEERKKYEAESKDKEEELKTLLGEIPNLPLDNVPEGEGEKDNKVLRTHGEPKKFSFTPKDHLEIGKELDLIDFEKASEVSGSGFYYLKNDGVLLELALVQYGMKFLVERGFTPVITPDLARERYYLGTGYMPKGDEAQTYTISGTDLGLVATAEVTLAGYHSDEVLNQKDLPKKYAGYSHCFRMESGAYGKYSKGLYRVHQFSKVEMFVYSTPQGSQKIHEELLKTEEEFWQSLEIPYRVVEICTGDLGAQAARKIDIEAWMPARNTSHSDAGGPGRGDYGEVTSTSNTTDYQARNLGIRVRRGDQTEYTHTLNGTLVAIPRAIIAILENFQQEDGSVVIPEALHPYMGKDKITA